MSDWFTVEKIDDSTFAISEYKHWEETHCYLLLGSEKALLIDTGLGVSNIKNVTDRLTSLPITVVTTHVHWDHIGGHRFFDDIAVHEAEAGWLSDKFPIPLQAVKANLLRETCEFPAGFDADKYSIFSGTARTALRNGDCLELGNRRLIVIHTPGHSPGHCCFFEPEKGFLYSGDLVYKGCLDAFYPSTDPLLFWESIRKIQALEISRVLPAHHQLHIPVSLIHEIEKGFSSLAAEGKLTQGSGVFDFGDFQIHV